MIDVHGLAKTRSIMGFLGRKTLCIIYFPYFRNTLGPTFYAAWAIKADDNSPSLQNFLNLTI
jgi:hypothetical protein